MQLNRKPTFYEKKLIENLIKKSGINFSTDWDKDLLVYPENDGGMGSLYLYPSGEIENNRKFGKQISELQFADEDGVDVIVSLNIDERGNLFELDIWKTDFSKLIRFPDINDLE